jgi:hypothetical protein
MAQLAFRYNVPAYAAANLGPYMEAAHEITEKLRRDLPVQGGNIHFLDLTKSDHVLVTNTALDVVNPTNASTYLHRVSQAGSTAGSTAVTGAVATSVILAVFSSNDTTHTVTDQTSEWVTVGHPPTAGHFDNTGGTNNTGAHLIFVFYNPPQTDAAVGSVT